MWMDEKETMTGGDKTTKHGDKIMMDRDKMRMYKNKTRIGGAHFPHGKNPQRSPNKNEEGEITNVTKTKPDQEARYEHNGVEELLAEGHATPPSEWKVHKKENILTQNGGDLLSWVVTLVQWHWHNSWDMVAQ